MKKMILSCMVLTMVLSLLVTAGTTFDYSAKAQVFETITQISSNSWKYEYTFTNQDTASIYYLNVWYNKVPGSYQLSSSWVQNSWYKNADDKTSLYRLPGPLEQPFYIYTSITNWPSGSNQIPIGDTWNGLSIVMDYYDSSPKQFGYMINGHNWKYDHLDAVGWTVPEPCTLLLTTGGLAILRKRG